MQKRMDKMETERLLGKYLPLFTAVLIVLSVWMAFRLYDREQYYQRSVMLDTGEMSGGWQLSEAYAGEALLRLEERDEVTTLARLDVAARQLRIVDYAASRYSINLPAAHVLSGLSTLYAQELQLLVYNDSIKFESPEFRELLETVHADLSTLVEMLPEEFLEERDENEIEERIEAICTTLQHSDIWFYCGGPPPTPTPAE